MTASARRTIAPPPIDVEVYARRVVVAVAASAGVVGVLCGVPLVATVLRAAAVLVAGLVLVTVAARLARHLRAGGAR